MNAMRDVYHIQKILYGTYYDSRNISIFANIINCNISHSDIYHKFHHNFIITNNPKTITSITTASVFNYELVWEDFDTVGVSFAHFVCIYIGGNYCLCLNPLIACMKFEFKPKFSLFVMPTSTQWCVSNCC